MLFVELLFAFLVALVLALLLIPLTSSHRPREGKAGAGVVLFLFLILFFATWAGGLWLTPIGPPLWGVYWLPFVLVGLFVALVLAATAEPSRRDHLRRREIPTQGAEAEATEAAAFGVMFWLLLIALLAAIIAAYTLY